MKIRVQQKISLSWLHLIAKKTLSCFSAFVCFVLLSLSHTFIFTDLAAGYPCFVVSIGMIGVCTAVIGDVAGHLGCFIYLKDSVNAIAFVALGTSVPGKIKTQKLSKIIIRMQNRKTGFTKMFFFVFTTKIVKKRRFL